MKRLIALVTGTLVVVASTLLPTVPAYGVDEQDDRAGVGDPILGDVLDRGRSATSSRVP